MRAKFADMLLVNGRFLTMERPGEIVDAVAVADGRILYVGTELEAKRFADEDTKVIDLQGRVAVPGLIDCHTHTIGDYAYWCSRLNLQGEHTTSLKNLLSLVRETAEKTPKGEWIIGSGFDESKFEEGPVQLTAGMLDEVAPDHPVFLTRTCGHIAVLNSLALASSGFTDASEPPKTGGGHFFRDENGHLTGMISGMLLGMVAAPSLSDEQRKRGMIEGVQEEYFRKGITATGEMGSQAASFRLLQELDKEGKLKLRIGFYTSGRRRPSMPEPMAQKLLDLGLAAGFGSERLRFLGIKFVMDGSTGGRTAAFSIPYADDPENYGELYNKQDELNEDMLKSARAGLQVSIHAIGDRAIEGALQSVEYANAQGVDTRGLRFRFEHLESPTPEQIERIKKLNISIGLSSAFIYALGDSHLSALGYERLVDAFPAKTLMDNGIAVGCNSDCPVCDVNPMYGLYAMITRITRAGQSFGGKKEAMDRIRALEAYTSSAAHLLCSEDVMGTLTVGKYADIVVFEQDYLNVPEEEIKDIQIYMTVSGGEIVYRMPE